MARDKLAAVVDPYHLRIAELAADPFQRPEHVFAAIQEPHIRRLAIGRMDVDEGQDPQLLPLGQLSWTKFIAQTSCGRTAPVRSFLSWPSFAALALGMTLNRSRLAP